MEELNNVYPWRLVKWVGENRKLGRAANSTHQSLQKGNIVLSIRLLEATCNFLSIIVTVVVVLFVINYLKKQQINIQISCITFLLLVIHMVHYLGELRKASNLKKMSELYVQYF